MAEQAMVRGVTGQIRWAYYVAAGVEGWAAVRDPKAPRGAPAPRWTLKARIVLSDPFKMSQRPLVFVATHARGRWVWPLEEFSVVNGQMSARCGPVEEY